MGDPLDPFGEGFPPGAPPVFPPFPGIPPIGPIGPIGPVAPITPIDTRKAPDPGAADRATAYPYFPKPNNSIDDMVFRGAIRQAQDVTPLIDGMLAFNEMEQAIIDAKSSVLMAFWAFNPDTKLISDSSKTWLDLLKAAAKRGVNVRVFMTDTDPALNLSGHVGAWFQYFTLYMTAGTLPSGQLQVVCSRHEAETSAAVAKQVRPNLYDTLVTEINARPDAERSLIYLNGPGLWDKLDFDSSSSRVKHKKPGENYPAFPAVHHTKLLIVDGRVAFAGGMNITPDYIDFPTHDLLPTPWHDAFVKVEGSQILRDFLRCYVGLWNQERLRCEKFLTDAFAARGVAPKINKTTALDLSKLTATPATGVTPKISSQVHRTVSKKGTSPLGVPDVVRQDILDGYLLAISKAEEYIYVENQYLRDKEMIDEIIKRAKVKKDLRVIFLIPKVAEELLDPTKTDELTLHGAALQYELLESMKSALRSRLGLFAMVRKDKKQIYVHSKLIIIDDQYASIGSANTNPRGFRMDSELDFAWHSRSVTERLRSELWKEILGDPSTMPSWKPKEFVDKWSAIARSNSGSGGVKNGFVVPFENKDRGKKGLDLLTPFT